MTLKQLEDQYKGITLENSGEFISAIKSATAGNDISSLSLIAFLNKITQEFIPEGKRLCNMADSLSEQEEARIIIHGKIMAAQMHILHSTRSFKDLSGTMLQFLELAAFLSSTQHDLGAVAVRCLTNGCTSLGFSWDNARSALSLDLIAYQIASKAEFNGPELEPIAFNGKGLITIKDGKLRIASSFVGENGALAFSLCDGAVEILTRNVRDERLKVSDQNDAVKLASFADYFIATQTESGKGAGLNAKAALKVGDTVTLKITEFSEDDEGYTTIKAMPLDFQDSPVGSIASEELIKGAFTEDLVPYIYDGDCFPGATVVELGDSLQFSIKDSYYQFSKDLASEDFRNNVVFEAKAVDIREDISRINWMTARGYMGISLPMEGIKAGDIAILTIQNIQTRNGDLYINVMPPKYGYDEVHYRFEEESVLASYVMDTAAALRDIRAKESLRKSEDEPKREIIRSLSRIFFKSLAGRSSLDKYKRILAASFLANSVGDTEDYNTARRNGIYLERLLTFAQGDAAKRLPEGEGWSKEQNDTILCISQFSSPGNIRELSAIAQDGSANSVAAKTASLILALGISEKFEDEIKANRDEVRKKICEMTGVSDHFRILDEVVLGKYGKGEGHHLEFKSSYVMRNDGKGPDLDYQGRGQVFEAVCGFLNSDGGTLYLGVNDKTGDPIISDEYGLNGDMKWFAENFSTVNSIKSRQLGHFIVKPDSLDHYVLFLNSEKELYFKKSIADMIVIEPTLDEDAIKFTVPACRYEIAYLYDDETHTTCKAFTRDGNRTIPMSRVAMERRLMEHKQLSKEVGFIVTLQQACDQKRKVILRGYHSGNSGEVRDRLVVPINLFYNDENVLCYDLESHSEKQFRLSRITSIDTDIPNPGYPHDFKQKQADVFRWIKVEGSYHIKLKMEVAARNYLLEEYSNAKNLPPEEFYQIDEESWILDTHLHGLGAVRRFYLGLADKIEILDTEDSDKLKENIRKYIETFLAE